MNQMKQTWNVWKLAIIRCSISCFIVGGTAYTTTMEGVKWIDLDGDQRFKVVLGVAIVVGGTVMAFLDRTIERISQGKPPVSTGDTQIIERVKI